MNECRELEPLLAPYVDGEAEAADRTRIEAHVASCACCRGRLAAVRTACESLRARRGALRACAPAALKSRCAAVAARSPGASPAVAGLPLPNRISLPRRWAPLAAAAVLVLGVAAVVGLGLTDKVQALALQATVDHVKCSRNLGSAAVDPLAAAEQWHARHHWPLRIPASIDDGSLELRAVRRCAVTDGSVAHLIYTWHGEPLSLYVLPEPVLDHSPAFARRFGHDAIMWTQHDRTYILVSQRRRDAALDRVVTYVRAHAY